MDSSVKIQLDPKQEEAVKACIDKQRRVVAVTGKAGTGKTSIIRHASDILTAAGYTVALAAPTGKAAKRIKEATGIYAQTFHRLLEFSSPGEPDPKTGKPVWESYPKRNRTNPLPYDVVIGDEYAMVHKELHGDITGAIKPGGRLLTFGDANQLPPIETGANAKTPSKFTELLEKFHGITLETIHRTGVGSGIASNGARVLRGMAPIRQSDFGVTITNQPVNEVLALVRDHIDDFRGLNSQVITPTNVSWVGQYKLNVAIQNLMQPYSNGWLTLARHEWQAKSPVRIRVGDKVVVNKNLYSVATNDGTMGVFNGETGIVKDIQHDTGEIEIDLGDRIAVIPPVQVVTIGDYTRTIYPHRELSLAYALTTHKCQGSEFSRVVYVMAKSQIMLLNRYNLYTGITRARDHVHVVSDMYAMSRACSNTVANFGG